MKKTNKVSKIDVELDKLIKLLDPVKLMRSIIEPSLKDNNLPDDVIKDVLDQILSPETNDFFRKVLKDAYKELFNEKEIRDLVKFYSSLTGKKLMDVSPLISQKVYVASKDHFTQLLWKELSKIRSIVEEHQRKGF